MAKRFCVMLMLVMTIGGLGQVGTTSAHSYAQYCSVGANLLNIYEHQNNGGAQDHACESDDHWGDSVGYIRWFNDAMSAYHIRDTVGGAPCVTGTKFFEHTYYQGTWFVHAPTADGGHVIEEWIGPYWNDRVSSHYPQIVC